MGYRSEELFGEGYRDAREVIAHEIFQLENTDILDTLVTTVFKDTDYGKKLAQLSDDISNGADSEFLDQAYEDDFVAQTFVGKMLDQVKAVTGKDVQYVLWLCSDPKEIIHAYQISGGDVFTEFDKYEDGDIILSDMGDEGVLFGYEKLPEKICTVDKDCNEI